MQQHIVEISPVIIHCSFNNNSSKWQQTDNHSISSTVKERGYDSRRLL